MKSNKTVSKDNKNVSVEDHYRKMFRRIQTETFLKIINDRSIALKYAAIGLNEMGIKQPDQQKIEEHADIMQAIARIILDERAQKSRGRTNTGKN